MSRIVSKMYCVPSLWPEWGIYPSQITNLHNICALREVKKIFLITLLMRQ